MLAVLLVGMSTFDVWLFTCGFDGCPSAQAIRAYRSPEGGRLLDRSGRSMGPLKSVRRVNVSLDDVPEHVRQAFLATEDRRFYSHGGLDWRGFARAVIRNVAALRVREGFSTITMQVARNTFLAGRAVGERSIGRKLLELRVARLLEGALPKDSILALYLNAIYLGNGVYGVEAASRDLFGKHIADLTVAEGAMLAALPKGPSYYTPRRDAARALERRNLVLSLMEDEGYLTPAAEKRAVHERLRIASREWRAPRPADSWALDLVRGVVDSVLRATHNEGIDVVVASTLDAAAQRAAQRAVTRRAAAIEREASGWRSQGGAAASAEVQGAMVAIDPRNGDVRALVGGRRYVRGAFDRAVSSHRQPGSAFKPFVYAAALGAGFTPASLVDDEPVTVDQGHGRTWTPANYGDEYDGRITIARALMRSDNAATVRISRAVGETRVADVARSNGIVSSFDVVPAIALGAVDVTPMELVTAYAPFANGGFRVRPRLVRRISRMDGTVLWSDTTQRDSVMDPRDAFQLTQMLRGVVDGGTGRTVRDLGVSGAIAGKTGTTNDGADVWFVGYTPTLAAGFWFGYDAPKSLGPAASGGRLAAPAWAQFYLEGWRESNDDWEPPDGLVERDIDLETGELAGDWCPLTAPQWFRTGTEPTESCDAHQGPQYRNWIAGLHDRLTDRLTRILRRLLRM